MLRKLLAAGQLDPDAETVIINSGDGLKTLDAVAPAITVPAAIKPTLEAFQAAGFDGALSCSFRAFRAAGRAGESHPAIPGVINAVRVAAIDCYLAS